MNKTALNTNWPLVVNTSPVFYDEELVKEITETGRENLRKMMEKIEDIDEESKS